ncbi:hypothetical protein OG994_16640 [Micromonospora globbae]|uniref:DUF3168 domain-containing protein n=1 Tax=Micromonospora globbae TaxID=1894969 RepID=A0ABZ1RZR0_9ACTN|nr:hypothetical protein [Micromonospora globbae]
MSLTGDRANIAAALSLVDGVTGYPKRPSVVSPGDGWPFVASLDRGPASVFEVTWTVTVVLPNDEQDAADWLDSHAEELAQALEYSHLSVGFVDRIEPVQVATSAGAMPAIEITMRGE